MATLLDEIIVQATRGGLSQSIAKGLSAGLAGSISNLAGSNKFSGLTFNDPKLAETVKGLQGQLPGAPAAEVPTELDPLVVTAKGGGASAGNALGQALAAGVSPSSSYPQGGSGEAPTQLSPFVLQAKAAPSLANIALPAGAAGAALMALSGSGGGGATPSLEPTLSPITVNTPEKPGMSATEAGLLAGGGGLAAGALLGGGGAPGGGAEATAEGGEIGPEEVAAGTLPFGLTMRDLLAGGLLAGGLLSNGSGDGKTAEAAGGGLQSIADSNAALADRLGSTATAGMAGNIGGAGMGSIARMVRKAQAAIRQRYSSMGMSGSTAEMQDLQAAAESGVDLQFKVGQEMAQTGLNAIAGLTGQSASIYAQLLNAQTAKDTALGNALANFAGSLVK